MPVKGALEGKAKIQCQILITRDSSNLLSIFHPMICLGTTESPDAAVSLQPSRPRPAGRLPLTSSLLASYKTRTYQKSQEDFCAGEKGAI